MNSISESLLYGFIAGALMFFGILWGSHLADSKMKEEAVMRGYAEWIVNHRGKTQFKWKEANP
jgi:hypothetical protein